MNIAKHRRVHYLSMKENWSQLHCLTRSFWFLLKQKLQWKQGFKLFKRTQKDITISNLFLDFFIRLTWHHYSYNHIPIHYNHEIINVIKIQNSPLQSFFVRSSFWVMWLWRCPFATVFLRMFTIFGFQMFWIN
jgi:hypothetical protein